MYGAVVPRAGGPAASVDNGDGTFTFQFDDGRPPLRAGGPIAQAKHQQLSQQAPVQPSPELIAAAQPGPDLRTAQSFGLGGGAPMPGLAQSGGAPPRSLADASAQGAANYVPEKKVESPAARSGATVPLERIDPSGLSFGQGGGAVPSMYVGGSKGGWQATTKAEQPGFKASEGLEASRQAAQGLSMDAVEREREAKAALTDHTVTRAATRAETVAQHVAEDENRIKFQQQEVSKRMAKLDELGNEISTKKIDPNKYMKDKGLLGQIGLTFAAAAGQFAAGIGGGTNAAMAKINADIERDIQSQHANLQGEKEKYARKSEGLKMLKEEYQSTNQQIAAHRVLALNAVEAQLDAQKAKLGPIFDDAEYAKSKATLQDHIATEKANFEKEAWTHTALHSKFAPPVAGGRRPILGPATEGKDVVPDGKGGFLALTNTTEKEGQEIRDQAGSVQGLNQITDRMVALRKSGVWERNMPGARSEYDTLRTQAINAVNVARKQRTITDSDAKRYEEEFGGGADAFFTGPGTVRLETIARTAQQEWRANVMARGALPAHRMMEVDPKTGQTKLQYRIQLGGGPPQAMPQMTGRGDAEGRPANPAYSLNSTTPGMRVLPASPAASPKARKGGRR